MLARLLRAALVVGIGALRHLVVAARHLDLAAGGKVVQGEVYRAAAVVARARARVGHELVLVLRRDVPEELGHPPWTIAVEHDHAVTLLAQGAVGADQRLRRRALQERPSFLVYGAADEVVRGRVAD